jgi:diguanylate cyclase (GGDEF)-like protein
VNRGLFNDRLNQALARATRTDKSAALLFIDLDNFKRINDSHGHKVGDQVLCAVAEALRSVVRQTDTVARLGGDEFTVLLEPLEEAAHADVVAKKILAALDKSILKSGVEVRVTASIGIAMFPDHARKADELINSADATMLFAKRSGGNRFRLAHPGLMGEGRSFRSLAGLVGVLRREPGESEVGFGSRISSRLSPSLCTYRATVLSGAFTRLAISRYGRRSRRSRSITWRCLPLSAQRSRFGRDMRSRSPVVPSALYRASHL